MPFNRKPQKFNASIKEVTIGCGEKAVTLGGENVYPFYSFDGEITNAPLYGANAANGGILITTKKGAAGKVSVKV